jgi:DNA transformation protein
MKAGRKPTERLEDLPNIGPTVARLLAKAGIRTPGELRRRGAVAAALRIRAVRPDDPPCRSMLAGLEGAIRGIRWHALPAAARERLWTEYRRRLEEA